MLYKAMPRKTFYKIFVIVNVPIFYGDYVFNIFFK